MVQNNSCTLENETGKLKDVFYCDSALQVS